MDYVGPAILLAQTIIDRTGIKHYDSPATNCVGSRQQRVGGKVGDDEADILVGQGDGCLGRLLSVIKAKLQQGEMLIEELAGGVVVLDREPRASNAVILGRLFDQG